MHLNILFLISVVSQNNYILVIILVGYSLSLMYMSTVLMDRPKGLLNFAQFISIAVYYAKWSVAPLISSGPHPPFCYFLRS